MDGEKGKYGDMTILRATTDARDRTQGNDLPVDLGVVGKAGVWRPGFPSMLPLSTSLPWDLQNNKMTILLFTEQSKYNALILVAIRHRQADR